MQWAPHVDVPTRWRVDFRKISGPIRVSPNGCNTIQLFALGADHALLHGLHHVAAAGGLASDLGILALQWHKVDAARIFIFCHLFS